MLVDSHLHLTHFSPEEQYEKINAAKALGVIQFVEVGTTAENSTQVLDLAKSRDDVFAGVAVHPWQLDTYTPSDIDTLRGLIQSSKKVVCIGECGLDYSQATPEIAGRQREMFRAMIRLARESNLPLNTHTDRLSADDLLTILHEEKAYQVGGMIHNFGGSADTAHRFHNLGFYTSVCVLVHHPLANRLRGVLADLPIGQIVLDSDAPGGILVRMGGGDEPYPHDMDKLSEPRMLRYIADRLAEVKGMAIEELEDITALNTRRLFKLPTPG